jgi:hypothetical protein
MKFHKESKEKQNIKITKNKNKNFGGWSHFDPPYILVMSRVILNLLDTYKKNFIRNKQDEL